MRIYVMCIDPERGRYMAVSNQNPSHFAIGESMCAAVGGLVIKVTREAQVIEVDGVDVIEESNK